MTDVRQQLAPIDEQTAAEMSTYVAAAIEALEVDEEAARGGGEEKKSDDALTASKHLERGSSAPPASHAGPYLIPKRPPTVQRELTQCSRHFDLQGKGFLDETEQALRRMDTGNRGFLDLNKVYFIMQTLQEEQKKSASLIDAIRTEQKKTLNLKKGLIALCGFTILLVLANVGTSFAAAILAKDTRISDQPRGGSGGSNDLVSTKTGYRVGTTSKLVEVLMQPISEETRRRYGRRRLDATTSIVCRNVAAGASCLLSGEIRHDDVVTMYQQFCPMFQRGDPTCLGGPDGGVAELLLTCDGKHSKLFGGEKLPIMGPSLVTLASWEEGAPDINYMLYPTDGQGFASLQTFSMGLGALPCDQPFDTTIYCPADEPGGVCFGFSIYTPSTCNDGSFEVGLCGTALSR